MASTTKMAQEILRVGKVSEVEMVYKSKIADKPQLSSSEKMYQALMENWDMNQIDYRETSKLVLLNRAMRCLGIITLSEGGLNDTMVDVRMAMQAALLANASVIVLSHNHPSGQLTPSGADDKLTQQIKQAGEMLNIKLVDHIIVTRDRYYSYCDEGRL